MKRFSLAFLALAAALAMAPAALADSWIYTISGSNFTATLELTGTDVGLDPGPGGSSVDAYVITSVTGTFTDPTSTYPIVDTTPVPAPGANAYSLTDADGYLFDNLLYPSLNPALDWGGLLLDVNGAGFYLNIFGGAFGSTDGLTAPGNTYYYFADNNDYANNPITAKADAEEAATATLTAVPEPGSLFLLGTGVLGLAWVLLRKASRPSCQILNA